MNKTLPTLYSKNSDGSINEWSIGVDGDTLIVCYGRVGGPLQTTRDTIRGGKNEGRANATTAAQQAVKEAKSKWTKKKKSGYVEKIGDAKAGKVDAVIAGGIKPMLAHKFRDHSAKISYPAYVQPKLDGIRCIAILKDGKCTLWSRTRNLITGVPHIAYHIEKAFAGKGDVVLDGELYNHTMKAEFEKIVSYVRQVKPVAGHEIVQYHIYDTVRPGTFEARTKYLIDAVPTKHSSLIFVRTVLIENEEDMMEWFNTFRADGYEGCMVRNAKGLYKNARSYDLQKVKEMDDAEFEICGTVEGRGKMAGKAVFACKVDPKKPTVYKNDGSVDLEDPNQFGAKMEGALSNLAQFLNNKKVIGKELTVRYQGFTNGTKPRFPVGVIVRDYE